MRWGIVAVVLCACNVDVPSDVQSGARLRARWLVADDGARVFAGLHDAELDADCYWSGGRDRRCIPQHESTSVFGDPSCSTPVLAILRGTGACGVSELVGVYSDPCGVEPPELWRVEYTVELDEVYRIDESGTRCIAYPADPAYTYRTTTPLARDELVGGRTTLAGTGRVRTQVIAGDDGSYSTLGPYDTSLDVACWMDYTSEDEPRRCRPEGNGTIYSLDSTCDLRVSPNLIGCTPPPTLSAYQDELRIWRRGERIEPLPSRMYLDVLSVETGWSCTPLDVAFVPGVELFVVGEEIDVASLPTFERVLEGSGRLQTWTQRNGDYRAFDGLFDSQLGEDCWADEVRPGEWRCLPDMGWAYGGWFYDDELCTQPSGVIAFGAAPVRYWERGDDCGGGTLHVHDVGAAIAPGSLYERINGVCTVYPQSPDEQVHTLGRELGFDAYARLTMSTD
jgi:hypothetical protein